MKKEIIILGTMLAVLMPVLFILIRNALRSKPAVVPMVPVKKKAKAMTEKEKEMASMMASIMGTLQ